MSKGIISKTGERVEFPAAEAALIGALTDIPEGGDFESKETTHILKLVKEFTAHRSVHPFDRSKIHRPLDNRGKLSISLPDDDENGKKWYRVWITTKITKDPHPGKGVETSPTRELFNLFKGAHALDVADLRDLCAIAIATRYSAYTEEQRVSRRRQEREGRQGGVCLTALSFLPFISAFFPASFLLFSPLACRTSSSALWRTRMSRPTSRASTNGCRTSPTSRS